MQYVPTQRARDGYPHAGPADGGCYETKKAPHNFGGPLRRSELAHTQCKRER